MIWQCDHAYGKAIILLASGADDQQSAWQEQQTGPRPQMLKRRTGRRGGYHVEDMLHSN